MCVCVKEELVRECVRESERESECVLERKRESVCVLERWGREENKETTKERKKESYNFLL